jgi:hypothetical protein
MNTLNKLILHPAWVTGFIDGEGTFYIGLMKNTTMTLGIQVQLQFSITQHIRDAELMRKLIPFFGTGTVVSDGPTKVQFRIRRYSDFYKSLFPLLDEFPLMTQKRLDAEAFRKAHAIIKDGRHLTVSGLDEIRALKTQMNRARMSEYKQIIKFPLFRYVYKTNQDIVQTLC